MSRDIVTGESCTVTIVMHLKETIEVSHRNMLFIHS